VESNVAAGWQPADEGAQVDNLCYVGAKVAAGWKPADEGTQVENLCYVEAARSRRLVTCG